MHLTPIDTEVPHGTLPPKLARRFGSKAAGFFVVRVTGDPTIDFRR